MSLIPWASQRVLLAAALATSLAATPGCKGNLSKYDKGGGAGAAEAPVGVAPGSSLLSPRPRRDTPSIEAELDEALAQVDKDGSKLPEAPASEAKPAEAVKWEAKAAEVRPASVSEWEAKPAPAAAAVPAPAVGGDVHAVLVKPWQDKPAGSLKSAKRLHRDGMKSFKGKDYGRAIELWTQAIAVGSSLQAVYPDLAYAYLKAEKFSECITVGDWCRERLTEHKRLGACLYNVGVCQKELGNVSGAIEAWESSLRNRENNVVRKKLAELRGW